MTKLSSWPLQPVVLALFVAYLQNKSFSYNTIATYVSAIAYFHKLQGYSDPADTFLVRKTLAGLRKLQPAVDTRLPITLDILRQLIGYLYDLGLGFFQTKLYKAMFLLAFFAFLRIGEMTAYPHSTHNIQVHNVQLGTHAILIHFQSFKHSKRPQSVQIMSRRDAFCPVTALKSYLAIRGKTSGPLFCWPNYQPILRTQFTDILQSCLKAANLSVQLYKGHSFRIGAATYAKQMGLSDGQIRRLGRWQSDAFLLYIRG